MWTGTVDGDRKWVSLLWESSVYGGLSLLFPILLGVAPFASLIDFRLLAQEIADLFFTALLGTSFSSWAGV